MHRAPLNRQIAWAYIDAAFECQPTMDGADLVSELRRQGAPHELVVFLQSRVAGEAHLPGVAKLSPHVRRLPAG